MYEFFYGCLSSVCSKLIAFHACPGTGNTNQTLYLAINSHDLVH